MPDLGDVTGPVPDVDPVDLRRDEAKEELREVIDFLKTP